MPDQHKLDTFWNSPLRKALMKPETKRELERRAKELAFQQAVDAGVEQALRKLGLQIIKHAPTENRWREQPVWAPTPRTRNPRTKL